MGASLTIGSLLTGPARAAAAAVSGAFALLAAQIAARGGPTSFFELETNSQKPKTNSEERGTNFCKNGISDW